MLRHLTYALLTCMLIASSGSAQTPPGRMSPQEANVIADYWIRSYLRRSATPAEQQRLGEQLLNARSPAHVLSGLLASRDYYAYAGGTPYDFIRQLTEDVCHHRPSAYE